MIRKLLIPVLCLMSLATAVEARRDRDNFRATLNGTIISLVIEPPTATVDFVGEGRATKVGRYTALFPHTVNLVTLIEEGDMTLVARDNSTVTIHLVGPSTPTETPNVLNVSVSGPVTGGTGRFAGATGFIYGTGVVDLAAGTYVGEMHGTLRRNHCRGRGHARDDRHDHGDNDDDDDRDDH